MTTRPEFSFALMCRADQHRITVRVVLRQEHCRTGKFTISASQLRSCILLEATFEIWLECRELWAWG